MEYTQASTENHQWRPNNNQRTVRTTGCLMDSLTAAVAIQTVHSVPFLCGEQKGQRSKSWDLACIFLGMTSHQMDSLGKSIVDMGRGIAGVCSHLLRESLAEVQCSNNGEPRLARSAQSLSHEYLMCPQRFETISGTGQ